MEKGYCPLCGEAGKAKRFLSSEAEGETFVYFRCQSCGLVFLDPRPNAGELLEFYSQDYYGEGEKKFHPRLESLRTYFARKRVQRVVRFAPRPGTALDIGCGQGTFLSLLKQKGWECHGTELTQKTAERASRMGISVSIGELGENDFSSSSLDLVTLWHVLEHLQDPYRILERVTRMLKPGGILAISTPNIDSMQARVFGGEWFHLDPPRHLYLFSPNSLRRMMDSLGYRSLKTHHLSMEQNPYGWLQSFLNRSGHPRNSLYSSLKTSSVQKTNCGLSSNPSRSLMLAGVLLPACALLSLGMAFMGSGGTIEAFFVKEG